MACCSTLRLSVSALEQSRYEQCTAFRLDRPNKLKGVLLSRYCV